MDSFQIKNYGSFHGMKLAFSNFQQLTVLCY